MSLRELSRTCNISEFRLESKNHRMILVKKNLICHPVPPPVIGRDTIHYPRLLQSPSSEKGRDGLAPAPSRSEDEQSCDCSLPCAADVDECRSGSHQCHYNQLCENTRGSYRCVCPRGFRAQGTARPCVGKLPLSPLAPVLCFCLPFCCSTPAVLSLWETVL